MKIAKIPKRLTILLIILYSSNLHGQYVSYGSDPSGQSWQQLETPHFKLIYPKSIDSIAQRYAWLLNTSYTIGSKTIGHAPRQIPVVLHPDNVNANGSVVWAPRRMELITTAAQQSYPQAWDKQLALHEFRHVAQIEKLGKGAMRFGYYLLGEQASALWLLPIPKWFLEGDAVATETALSSSGRGRSAEFHMAYRAHLLSNTKWSYDKWVNGSYKHFVPDIYHLGYENVAYARYRYGADIWDRVLSESSKRYFKIPAFSNALKRHTGLNAKKLHAETFSFLKEQWQAEDTLIAPSSKTSYLTPESKEHVSYRSILPTNNTTFIALKESMDKAFHVVHINRNGKESHLFSYSNINGNISSYGEKLYWSENVNDPRWEQRSYANIKSFDFASKTIKKHTHKARYFTPTFNDSISFYAASTTDREGRNFICLLDANSHIELMRHSVPHNSHVNEIAWKNAEGQLIVTVINDKGMGIYDLAIVSGEWKTLLAESYTYIKNTSVYDEYLIFESWYSGVSNIYALRFANNKIYKVTSSRFGAVDPSAYNGSLYFSDYHKNGFRLAKESLTPQDWSEIDWGKPYRHTLADTLSAQESVNIDTIPIPSEKLYESKPYRKLTQLFRFHSWMPFYSELKSEMNFDSNELTQTVKPGLTLLSQNSLSTAVTRLGYSYENGYNAGHASFTYYGWYPVVDITASYGGGKQDVITDGKLSKGDDYTYDIGANIYVPLTFKGTRSTSGFTPQVSVKHSNSSYYIQSKNDYKSETRLDLYLQHYTYSRSSVRDIYPRWGYRMLLAHRSMPFDTDNFGAMFGAKLTLYTPGLLANHGLKLSGSIQYQEVERYYMSNLISFPRGYSSFPSKELRVFSADYAFPVAYPDFNIGSLLYVKRLRMNLFSDVGRNYYYGKNGLISKDLLSYGVDVTADYHIFRKEFPFMSGIRIVKPKSGSMSIEGLFNVSF